MRLPPELILAVTDPAQQVIDWDLVLKALGFIVSAILAYNQMRSYHFTSRTSLKTDLEILKLLDPGDANHELVKTSVSERIQSLYAQDKQEISWGVVIYGLLWTFGFVYWTVRLVEPEFSWWSLLTGYLAFAGMGMILAGWSGRSRHRKSTPSTGTDSGTPSDQPSAD
jgi:hypothetical protein